MKKVFLILNILLIAATLVSGYCYYEFGGLELKALTSSGFVITGIANLIYAFISKTEKKFFPIFMVLGLFFSLIGDIVINLSFIPGALIFALGHIFYFTAYCGLAKFKVRDLVPCGVIFIISLMILTLYPGFDFDTLIFTVCVFYALIISCMVGKTVSNLICERNTLNSVLVAGSTLFFISDLALVLYMFGNAPKVADTVCLATYFPAQCILAYGILLYTAKKQR